MNFLGNFLRIFLEDVYGEMFTEEFFWDKFFERIFFGEIFWDDFFWRNFLGGIFFGRIFLGGFFWEEFFWRNYLVEINKELMFSQDFGVILSQCQEGRKDKNLDP